MICLKDNQLSCKVKTMIQGPDTIAGSPWFVFADLSFPAPGCADVVMFKRFVLAAVVLALLFGGVIGFKLYKRAAIRDQLATAARQPVHITATLALGATWDRRLAATGALRARHGVDIRSEADGVIRRLHVASGQTVGAGDVLVEIDATVEQATLKSARARLEKARLDFERDRALFERRLVPASRLDSSRAELESAEALVEQTQGIIARKIIKAPFAGTLGIHNLAEGQYLETGDEVVSLQALDRLYLDIYLPEKELQGLRTGQRVVFRVPGYGVREFASEVRFVDVVVQAETRNVLLRAEVENRDHALLPGMFADAEIILDEAREVVVVPRQAVAFSLYGETVYQVEPAGEAPHQTWLAHRKTVRTGEVRGERIAIAGLDAGQMIALDSQHRLLEGTPVMVENLAELQAAGAATKSP